MAPTLGFLGFGNMAKALLQGALSRAFISPETVLFSRKTSPSPDIESQYGITECRPVDLASCAFIVLAVKPQQLHAAAEALKPHLTSKACIISLLAGTPLSVLSSTLGADIPIVRAMPNTPVHYGVGMTAIAAQKNVTPSQLTFVRDFFLSVGECMEIDDSVMDAVTGLSGSGPAFLYAIADAMIAIGIQHGLSADTARFFVAQTLLGAGQSLKKDPHAIPDLIRAITSPNGTTAAGAAVFQERHLSDHIQAVVQAAILRSKELSHPD